MLDSEQKKIEKLARLWQRIARCCHLVLARSQYIDDSLLKAGRETLTVETGNVDNSRRQTHAHAESRDDHLFLTVTCHYSTIRRPYVINRDRSLVCVVEQYVVLEAIAKISK